MNQHERELLDLLNYHQVVVVVGQTGSGKTTQIPQILDRAGYTQLGKIGVTQPRRIAAISTAQFVAQGLEVTFGKEVGYQIRFDDQTNEKTRIKFMTDGILLRELLADPDLKDYSVIMVDEAHERSLNIDLILGLLKDLLKRGRDLKVIITSATIDPEKFSRYFDNAPILSVAGKMYPVRTMWSKEAIEYDESDPSGFVRVVTDTAKTMAVMPYEKGQDLIIFMTGKEDIDLTCAQLRQDLKDKPVIVLPVYGAMMPDEQQKMFAEYPGKRKIVVATNIAETSLTPVDTFFEIDSGYVKEMHYDPRTGVKSLRVVKHSRAGCDQRKGRLGRTQPGVCIRLYSEHDYKSRPEFTEPEIKRTDLAGMMLQMLAMGFTMKAVEDFHFIDPPEKHALGEAHRNLRLLGALDKEDALTDRGRMMARLPFSPSIGRIIIAGQEYGCVKEAAKVAATLSARSPLNRPQGKEQEADAAHRNFRDPRSDFQTFINVLDAYRENRKRREWCKANFLDWRLLGEADRTYDQILDLLRKEGIELSEGAPPEAVTKAVLCGLPQNICIRMGKTYMKEGVSGIWVHPSSTLHIAWRGKAMVVGDIVTTRKIYARNCAAIEAGWLLEIFPDLCSVETKEIVSCDTSRKIAVLRDVIYFRGEIAGSKLREVTIKEAREFQTKLIEGALRKGWFKITIGAHAGFAPDLFEFARGRWVYLSPFDRKEPGNYYFSIERRGGRWSATKQFRITELPEFV